MVETETNTIHPVAFIYQPVATPHQPRYAQQLPPGGSQGHFVPAGRLIGAPYSWRGVPRQRAAKSRPYGCGKNRGAHTIQSATCEIILFKDWSCL